MEGLNQADSLLGDLKRKSATILSTLTLTICSFSVSANNVIETPPVNVLAGSKIVAVPIVGSTLVAFNIAKEEVACLAEEKKVAETLAAKVVEAAKVADNTTAIVETAAAPAAAPLEVIEDKTLTILSDVSIRDIILSSPEILADLAPAMTLDERRQNIALYAESYTGSGIRYRYGGTSIETGIDCSAFTRYALEAFGVNVSRTSREQYTDGEQIDVEEVQPGDLVFFGKKYISHVALVVENSSNGLFVVHSTSRGIVKDNILESDYWRPKLRSTAVRVVK